MRNLGRISAHLPLLLFLTTTGLHALQAAAQSEIGPDNSPPQETIALFNGKNLDGWKPTGNARWEVKNGLLLGQQGPNGEAGDLLTTATYKDFELTVTFRVKWPANSGVWFRYQSDKMAYQADILENKGLFAYSGSLYCPGKTFLATNVNREIVDREGWNKLLIRAEDDRLVIHINEKKVADVRDDLSAHGQVGLQVHRGDVFTGMQIMVKEFRLRPL